MNLGSRESLEFADSIDGFGSLKHRLLTGFLPSTQAASELSRMEFLFRLNGSICRSLLSKN